MASITLRMLLSVLCGGLIGIEREYKRRPARLPPPIFSSVSAQPMVSLTSQFLFLNMHYYLDVSRMSASVTAGIGFIGAGSIIVTRQQRVKGLTTAAGLWAAAIIGLAVGSGFYEGALLATVLVLLAEAFLSKLEYWMMDHAPEINLYMEYETRTAMDAVLQLLRAHRVTIQDMEIHPPLRQRGPSCLRHFLSALQPGRFRGRATDTNLAAQRYSLRTGALIAF